MTPKQLIHWRKGRGLSQEAAADLLGLGRRQWSNYEHGNAPIPKAIELACAAVTLGISEYTGGNLRAGIMEDGSNG